MVVASSTKSKRLTVGLLAIVGFSLAGLGSMNVLLDPFGVFGTSSLPQSSSSNERFLKVKHLQDNPGAYEALILGSSRSGMTDPAWVETFTGRRTYNLAVFSAKPSDMAKLYQAAVESNQRVEIVVLGIDAMSFLNVGHDADLSRRHHPSVHSAGELSYWLDYLLAPSFLVSAEKIFSREAPPVLFDYDKGTYTLAYYDKRIEENHDRYMDETFDHWKPLHATPEFNEREWLALEGLARKLTADEVSVFAFVQPVHRQWADRMGEVLVETRRRARELGIEDLSDLAKDKDEYWYEQRHYRSEVAHAILENLFLLGAVEVIGEVE